jgi:hypothetical protein
MLHKIKSVRPKQGQVLELAFDDGAILDFDVSPLISSGGVWNALANQAEFAKVTISSDGRYIEWPGELDICADALWLQTRKRRHHVA